MAEQSIIFKKDEQEVQQGQIQSNNSNLDPLALRGSANNGDQQITMSVSLTKIIKDQSQPFRHLKDSTSDQFQNSEFTKNDIKYQKETFSKSNNHACQNVRHLESKERFRKVGGLDYSNSNSYQYKNSMGLNSYQLHSKGSYNLYKNKLNGYTKQIENNQQKVPYSQFSRAANSNYQEMEYHYNSSYLKQNQTQNLELYSENQKKEIQNKNLKSDSFTTSKRDKNENYKIKHKQKMGCRTNQEKSRAKQQIEKHKIYFKDSDWQRLLFIIQEIILENNNGVKHLWDFINNLDPNKKLRKGKRIFQILSVLGMEQIFDKLITQQKIYKEERKLKQTKMKTLIFNLVSRIS